MRLAFMGSPGFAVPALHALHGAGHDIVAVYAQPPRPAGRGQAVRRCAVHEAADALGLPVRTPVRLRRDEAAQAAFRDLNLDVAVVAAYGLILPPAMLDAPRLGCLNIHASLLPRWRGAGPIQAAVLAGDAESGVTIMQMEEGLDTGPMLLREAVALGPRTTAAELHGALADLGARMVVAVLPGTLPGTLAATLAGTQAATLAATLAGTLAATPQPEGATYAPKLTRDSGRMDWTQDAATLDRTVRAMIPWPGAFTKLGGETLKVLDAYPEDASGTPGTTLDAALLVACGTGALRLLRVQRPGRAPMDAAPMLRGHAVPAGTRLG